MKELAVPSSWSGPSDEICLRGDEIHIWRADLGSSAANSERLAGLLSADELARAGRFRFSRDRREFVAARGILRDILARYIECHPSQVSFSYCPNGKPELAGCSGPCFNVSHSGGIALYAIAWNAPVGVDVERIRPNAALEHIASSYFTERERLELRALGRCEQVRAFFSFWTAKEALLKASGKGLLHGFDSTEVSFVAEGRPNLIGAGPSPWALFALEPGKGFAGAVAVPQKSWQLKLWHWEPKRSAKVDTRPGLSMLGAASRALGQWMERRCYAQPSFA